MDDRECIKRLEKWGLNELQAKVYLDMSDGSSTVRQISKLADVNRAETYKVLSDLEVLGLVELLLGRPKLYRLRDPKEVFPSLLENRKKELQGLEREMDKTRTGLPPSRERIHNMATELKCPLLYWEGRVKRFSPAQLLNGARPDLR